MGAASVGVTVVGGELGAGKTTLLNHLLRHAAGRRLGVIVNDFGSINVDGELVVGVDGDLVQLGNGCICCTIEDDLVESLQRLLAVPEPPEHVIIEASGVSDPRRVAGTLEKRVPREMATVDAVVVVLDVERYLEASRRERIVAGGSIAAADILVLNKIDLVDDAALDALEERMRRRARGGRVLRAVRGAVAPALVVGVGAFDPERLAEAETHEPHVHELSSHSEPGVHHHHHDHGDAYWTWAFRSERPLSARRLRRAVDDLPPRVVRAKGTVLLASHPDTRAVMHVVGRRAELSLDEPWGEREPKTGLVVIGSGEPLAPSELEARFRACEVEPGDGGAGGGVMRWVRRVFAAN